LTTYTNPPVSTGSAGNGSSVSSRSRFRRIFIRRRDRMIGGRCLLNFRHGVYERITTRHNISRILSLSFHRGVVLEQAIDPHRHSVERTSAKVRNEVCCGENGKEDEKQERRWDVSITAQLHLHLGQAGALGSHLHTSLQSRLGPVCSLPQTLPHKAAFPIIVSRCMDDPF
jgi:hypothetical protein